MRPLAIVTGGSGGIGRATALRLAHAGFDLCICYRSGEGAASAVAAEAAEHGASTLIQRVDVTSNDDVQVLTKAVYSRWERVSLLVNNAGIVRDRAFAL